MKLTAACILLMGGLVAQSAAADAAAMTKVEFKTTLGSFVVELDSAKAPKTVANFVQYVRDGFYSGTIFHRVIKGFMVQGGGLTSEMDRKAGGRAAVANEARNGLRNDRGTIAMARTNDPHSATSQFFVNTVNNDGLNFRGESTAGWGYCVFGKVVSGMDVIDKIEASPTTMRAGAGDVPVKPITIESATIAAAK